MLLDLLMTVSLDLKNIHSSYRILGIFPHPDDEAYAVSGTFAGLCRLGAHVELICATDGEAGMHRGDSSVRGKDLGNIRRAELLKSAQEMGASGVDFLGLPDGGLASLDENILPNLIGQRLDAFNPHVVVTLGYDGVYGHIDHVALTRAVDKAFLDSRYSHIRLMHCAFPRRLFSPTFKILKKHAGYMLDKSVKLESLGVMPEDCDVIVAISDLADTKRGCIESHLSQLLEARAETFLLPGLEDHLLQEEWFQWIAGPGFEGPANSLLEGLEC